MNYSVKIRHGRFRDATTCLSTSDFTNSHHKAKKSKTCRYGKAIAQKTKQAHEAQKKAFIEAQSIIANNRVKQADKPPVSVTDPPQST